MDKRTKILAVATLAAVAVATWLVMKRAPEAEGSLLGEAVLPQLAEKLNDVTQVRVVGAGDQPLLTLQREGEQWTVAERGGYPADAGKVRTALINLGESRVVEAKTANPERYAQLGVEDVEGADAKGVRVELRGEGVEQALIIGNTAGQQGEGTYVRRPGEAQSLMAAGNLLPDREIGPWLRREISDLPSSRIREIELVAGDGRPLRVYKDAAGDANFKVADVPRGRTLQSEQVANGLASMLSGLTLDDVARDDGGTPEGATLHTATYRFFDGIVVTLTGWPGTASAEGSPAPGWIRLQASLDADAARAHATAEVTREQAEQAAATEAEAEAADTAPEAGATAAAEATASSTPATASATAAVPEADIPALAQARVDALQAEVDALNARVAGWRFQVPAYKFANVDKSIDDLLQARED